MTSITNLVALRSFPYSSGNETIFLEGYATLGDGGEGLFYWDSSSTDVDNDGTVIQVTSVAVGRWVRNYADSVSVKWFGAAGDGVTDDTVAVQRAMNANIGKLVFSKGNYLVTDTIAISSYVVVDFHNAIVTFDNATIDKPLFSITRKTRIALNDGLFIDKNSGVSRGIHILGEPTATWPIPANHYTSDVLINAIQMINFRLSVYLGNATRRVNITNCNLFSINGVKYEGKTVENVIDGTVIFCSTLENGCYGVGTFGRSEHVTLYPEGLAITNCTIDNYYNSFHIENIYTLQVTNNYLGANSASGNSTFYFKKGTATHTNDIIIGNNMIYGRGIIFDPGTASPYKFKAQIVNCNFLAQRSVNVTLNNWASFIAIRGCKFADAQSGGQVAVNAVNNNLNLTISDVEIDETYISAPVQIKGTNSLNTSLSFINYRGTGATLYLQQSPLLGEGIVNNVQDVPTAMATGPLATGTYISGASLGSVSSMRLGRGQRAILILSAYIDVSSPAKLKVNFPANISIPQGTGWTAAEIEIATSQYVNVAIPIVATLAGAYTFTLQNDVTSSTIQIGSNGWMSVQLS